MWVPEKFFLVILIVQYVRNHITSENDNPDKKRVVEDLTVTWAWVNTNILAWLNDTIYTEKVKEITKRSNWCSLSTFLATMVQIQMIPLPSTTDSHSKAQNNKSFDSIISQHQLSDSTGANISDSGTLSKSNLSSFITWTSKSEISSNRSSVQPQSSVVCNFASNQFFWND